MPRPAATDSRSTSEPERAPRQRFGHLRSLDGLRGVAVLVVVLYHFAPDVAPGGFLGVDLFFVLSGFLITSLLVSEWRDTRAIALGNFWLRRARRLLPALLLLLAAVAIYELFVETRVQAHHTAPDGLWSLFYLANWHFIADQQSYLQQFLFGAPSPLRHTWSLAIEEQFYLVWPLVVVGVGALVKHASRNRVRRPPREYRAFRTAMIAVCVVGGIASFIAMLSIYHPGDDPSRVYYGTDTRAFIVLVGALVGVLSAGVPTVGRRFRGGAVVLGVLTAVGFLGLVATVDTADSALYQGAYLPIAILMAVMLVGAGQPGPNPLATILRWRPLVGLGLISYGVYLWHWPIGLWVDEAATGLDGVALFTLRCALTLLAALASYFLLELPIRHGRKVFRPSTGLGLAAAVGVLVVAGAFVVPIALYPDKIEIPARVALTKHAQEVTAGYMGAPRCDAPLPVPATTTTPPTTAKAGRSAGATAGATTAAPTPRVLLVGNSLAIEAEDCLGKILSDRGVELTSIANFQVSLCDLQPQIDDLAANPATRPTVAVLFSAVAHDPRCPDDWTGAVDRFVSSMRAAGVGVVLAPSVPYVTELQKSDTFAEGVTKETAYYADLAVHDPGVTTVDAGEFVRDANGTYPWRMPCTSTAEAGCDATGTLPVRALDGFHFCSDPNYFVDGLDGTLVCGGPQYEGGSRRMSAALGVAVLRRLGILPAP